MTEISKDLVEAQLKRLLASPEFVSSKRLSQFLRFVVEQTIIGKPHQIKQYTIGVEAMGLGDGFDPESNPTVRIHARKLRRALDHYYFKVGPDDSLRIDIPKGGYVPTFTMHPGEKPAAGKLDCTPCLEERSPANLGDPAIAVVLFESLDTAEKYAYLARGLTAEVIASLTRFDGFKVLGPLYPSMAQSIDLQKIRHEYGARFVLQGTVRSAGSQVRITTDLTDTTSTNKRWAKSFDFDLEKTSLFDIEDQVTSHITGAIADGLGVISRILIKESYSNHIRLNEVTSAVLKYNAAWMTQTPEDWKAALTAVKRALVDKPDNALMTALLSNLCYADWLHGLEFVPDAGLKMKSLAYKAVSLDPHLQIARYNLVVQKAAMGLAEECVAEARSVLAMNAHHSRVLSGCAVATTSVGAYEFGLELIGRAKRLNPHYPGWYHFIDYLIHYGNERYGEAWQEAQKIHVKGLIWHPIIRASMLGKLGRTEQARPYVNELLTLRPDFPKKPHAYLRRLYITDKHVDLVWDGLTKAGIIEGGG